MSTIRHMPDPASISSSDGEAELPPSLAAMAQGELDIPAVKGLLQRFESVVKGTGGGECLANLVGATTEVERELCRALLDGVPDLLANQKTATTMLPLAVQHSLAATKAALDAGADPCARYEYMPGQFVSLPVLAIRHGLHKEEGSVDDMLAIINCLIAAGAPLQNGSTSIFSELNALCTRGQQLIGEPFYATAIAHLVHRGADARWHTRGTCVVAHCLADADAVSKVLDAGAKPRYDDSSVDCMALAVGSPSVPAATVAVLVKHHPELLQNPGASTSVLLALAVENKSAEKLNCLVDAGLRDLTGHCRRVTPEIARILLERGVVDSIWHLPEAPENLPDILHFYRDMLESQLNDFQHSIIHAQVSNWIRQHSFGVLLPHCRSIADMRLIMDDLDITMDQLLESLDVLPESLRKIALDFAVSPVED